MAVKISSEQILELLKMNQPKNGQEPLITGDDLQALIDNPKVWRSVAKNVDQEVKPEKPTFPPPTITLYSIAIRHRDNFAQRIQKLACNWLHPWITAENTPVVVDKKKGVEKKEVFVVHLNRSIGSDDAVAALAALDPPLKPAVHEDLIAFGTDHKEVQREFPIVQLGSSWVHPDYGRVVSYLGRHDSDRVLSLRVWHGEWHAACRFLAVRA